MPQIDTPLLLDILLGLVILLFIPFGIRRGVAKEAMVSAGILLGATLAERFGDPWGAEISARFTAPGLEQDAATFAASALLLFGCTFLLGYGGGAALGPTRPGTLSRLVGGLLAAFNAALLLSYLLLWIDGILQQGGALDDGIVSAALVRQTNLLLLAGAGVLLAITIVGWVVNVVRSRRQPHENVGSAPTGMPARQRPVRLATAADAGKYEPEIDQIARSGRFGPGIDATSPITQATPYDRNGPWADDGIATRGTNGHSRGVYDDGANQFAPGAPPVQNDETVWAAWSGPTPDQPRLQQESSSQWPVAPSVGVTDDDRCAVCRARVGPRDVFCPECGATL